MIINRLLNTRFWCCFDIILFRLILLWYWKSFFAILLPFFSCKSLSNMLTRCCFDVEWWGNKNIYHFRCPLHYDFIKNPYDFWVVNFLYCCILCFNACIETLTWSKETENSLGSSILVVDCSKYTHDLFDIDTRTIIRMAVNGQLLYPISLECLFNYF